MPSDVLTPTQLGGLQVRKAAERPPNINMLVFADSGWGKTTLMGSADAVPEMRKVLVLDFEGGDLSLSHSYPNVDIVSPKTWPDCQDVYDSLWAGGHGYGTVVVDSLTEIQKLCMYFVMGNVLAENPNREEYVPSMREWGINLEMMRKFVRGMRDLPINVLFTALVVDDQNKRTGLVTKKPSLTGKLKNEVAAFLDIVAYGYIKEVVENNEPVQMRLLLTQSTDEIIAKDRTGKLPQVVVEPTMKQLYDLFDLSNTKKESVA